MNIERYIYEKETKNPHPCTHTHTHTLRNQLNSIVCLKYAWHHCYEAMIVDMKYVEIPSYADGLFFFFNFCSCYGFNNYICEYLCDGFCWKNWVWHWKSKIGQIDQRMLMHQCIQFIANVYPTIEQSGYFPYRNAT